MIKDKRWTYRILFILTTILVALFAVGISVSNSIIRTTEGLYLFESQQEAKIHLAVILDDSDSNFDQDFTDGLMAVAEENAIAVEIMPVDSVEYDVQVLKALDKAMFANVDGIALYAYDTLEIQEKINQVTESGIPVILMNEDVPSSDRISYVGLNRYHIGMEAGESFVDLLGEEGKIAVIDQRRKGHENETAEEILLLGMKEIFNEYPNLTLETVAYTEEGVLSAERVANGIFTTYPDITGILCMNGRNTLGIVQMLIDSNRVNDVVLIGSGNNQEIIEYISRGNVIEATVVSDNHILGKKVAEGFLEYLGTGFVSNFINIDTMVINQKNVDDYIDEMGDGYE